MADRYWVGDGGNWSDNTNHWSAASGDVAGASLPTSSDNVYFDANSFTIAGQTVTVDATAYCIDMDWTGATNTPDLTFGNVIALNVYGTTVTFISDMTITQGNGTLYFRNTGAGNTTFISGGVTFSNIYTAFTGGGTLLLSTDNLICSQLEINTGHFNTGNLNVICSGTIYFEAAAVSTITLGSSTISSTRWAYTGSNVTFAANTATINVSGTGTFAGGDITTYYDVNLNGSAHALSGDFTCDTLTLKSDATQTITMTAGQIITCNTATLDGDSTHAHAIVSSTPGTLASLIAGTVTDDYVTYTDIRRSWETLLVGEVGVQNRMLSVGEAMQLYQKTKWRYKS